MPTNVEIKARVADLAELRARAIALGAHPLEELHQIDTFYRVAQGRLKLRQLSEDAGELIFYRRPDQPGPKLSEYSIYRTSRPKALGELLRAFLEVRGVVEKRRQVLLIGQTRVHLDQVEELGTFLELEVVLAERQSPSDGTGVAHRLLDQLGVPAAALASGAYIDLLEGASR